MGTGTESHQARKTSMTCAESRTIWNENKDDNIMIPIIYNSPTLFGQHVYMITLVTVSSPHYVWMHISCYIDSDST